MNVWMRIDEQGVAPVVHHERGDVELTDNSSWSVKSQHRETSPGSAVERSIGDISILVDPATVRPVVRSDSSGSTTLLPAGIVTFLFTDVEGSARLWGSESRPAIQHAIRRHHAIISGAISEFGGYRPTEQGEGDSLVGAFRRPSDALRAAVAAQRALNAEPWRTSAPLRVRMSVNTGEAQFRDASCYDGQTMIRSARLRDLAHGGQILVSGTARDLALDNDSTAFSFVYLGEHRLRDLDRVERVWQLFDPQLPSDFRAISSTVPTHAVPLALSPFVGRDQHLVEVATLVRTERLVVVTGSGGSGKSRFVQEVARNIGSAFAAGLWWAEMPATDAAGDEASLDGDASRDGRADTEDVEAAIRRVIGIGDSAHTTTADAISRLLGPNAGLLIIDGCERAAVAVAQVVEQLLGQVVGLHVLATSTVGLGVMGERVWRIPGMEVPSSSCEYTVDELTSIESVRLFEDRARRARPNFAVTADNSHVIAEICRRLGGIPLAVELAAARCRMMSPSQVLDGLGDALSVLGGGSKVGLQRQRTMEASIRWSVSLLDPSERNVLMRLSTFVDGWTLSAAEAVCGPPSVVDGGHEGFRYEANTEALISVIDGLDRLIDHNLVMLNDDLESPRYSMLEVVRQFAAREIRRSPSLVEDAETRHAEFYLEWVRHLAAPLRTDDVVDLYDVVTADQANLVHSFRWMIGHNREFEAVEMLEALYPVAQTVEWAAALASMIDALESVQSTLSDSLRHNIGWFRVNRTITSGDLSLVSGLALQGPVRMDSMPLRNVGDSARSYLLAIQGGAGVDVLDELVGAIDPNGAWRDDEDAVNALVAAECVSAFQTGGSRYSWVETALDRDLALPRLSVRLFRDTSAAIRSLVRGDLVAAGRSAAAPAQSRFHHVVMRQLAILGAAISHVERGAIGPLPAEIELRNINHVGSGTFAQASVALIDGARQLFAGEAERGTRDVVESFRLFTGVGVVPWLVMEWLYLAEIECDIGVEIDRPGVHQLTSLAPWLRIRSERAFRSGSLEQAFALLCEAIDIEVSAGFECGLVRSLELAAHLLSAKRDHLDALKILGSCDSARLRHDSVRTSGGARRMADIVTVARSVLVADAVDGGAVDGARLDGDVVDGDAVDGAIRLGMERSLVETAHRFLSSASPTFGASAT